MKKIDSNKINMIIMDICIIIAILMSGMNGDDIKNLNSRINDIESSIDAKNSTNDVIDQSTIVNNNLSFFMPILR